MDSKRRNLLGILGSSAFAALLPASLFSLLSNSTRSLSSRVVNRVTVHAPEEKNHQTALIELDLWSNGPKYRETLARLQQEGALVHYSISLCSLPFVIELEFRSQQDRQRLIDELAVRGIINDQQRVKLGYSLSESLG